MRITACVHELKRKMLKENGRCLCTLIMIIIVIMIVVVCGCLELYRRMQWVLSLFSTITNSGLILTCLVPKLKSTAVLLIILEGLDQNYIISILRQTERDLLFSMTHTIHIAISTTLIGTHYNYLCKSHAVALLFFIKILIITVVTIPWSCLRWRIFWAIHLLQSWRGYETGRSSLNAHHPI